MKHKKIVIIVVALAIATTAGLAFWLQKDNKSTKQAGPLVISGQVTNINNGCQHDDTCSVTLDNNKIIITGCGLSAHGTCKSYPDQSKLTLGQHVEATVMQLGNNFNLECDTCTIRPATE